MKNIPAGSLTALSPLNGFLLKQIPRKKTNTKKAPRLYGAFTCLIDQFHLNFLNLFQVPFFMIADKGNPLAQA